MPILLLDFKEYDLLLGGLSVLSYVSYEAGKASLRTLGGVALILLIISRYFFRFSKRKYV